MRRGRTVYRLADLNDDQRERLVHAAMLGVMLGASALATVLCASDGMRPGRGRLHRRDARHIALCAQARLTMLDRSRDDAYTRYMLADGERANLEAQRYELAEAGDDDGARRMREPVRRARLAAAVLGAAANGSHQHN